MIKRGYAVVGLDNPKTDINVGSAMRAVGVYEAAMLMTSGATPLHEYKHPERAFYVFGAEDATLGRRVLDRCRDTIYIPTQGCMNLAATVNVVLYDRLAKQLQKEHTND